MFGIATNAGGQCQAFPDVCKTPAPPAPPVPVPYPNIVMLNQANPGKCSKKVLILNKNVLTKKSEVPMSTGDEAGAAGGVMSSKIKGEGTFLKKFSMKVKVEGQNVLHQTCLVSQNGKGNANCPAGVQSAPSQLKVLVSG